MPLTPGMRLGSHEILAALGAGGMGEVYRARDTRLGRDVAIKVLPAEFAADPDRVGRFEREARALAALQHPHIAGIHDLLDHDGRRHLVLELVPGETLAARLRRGPLPLDEALSLGREIAQALEAAHERGVVHRDLKPGNVMVTPDGHAKVLDFGLAKLLEGPPGVAGAALDDSPTRTAPAHLGAATSPGVILGTAAYMSPEQAQGREVDRRADIWAFGCVLFEMLSGRRAFDGTTSVEVLAQVLEREPAWEALPAVTPPTVQRLLRRCLRKRPALRLDSAVAARLDLEEALSAETAPSAPSDRSRRLVPLMTGAGGAVAAAALTWLLAQPAPPVPAPVERLALAMPRAQRPPPLENTRDIAISSDGRALAFRAGGSASSGGPLALRTLDRLAATVLPGITAARAPFFSPDGRWIGFMEGSDLKKVSVSGGAPVLVVRNLFALQASWDEDGTIVFDTFDSTTGLLRVAAEGGSPQVLTTPKEGEGDHVLPSVLPRGRGVLFSIVERSPFMFGSRSRRSVADADNVRVAVLDLRTGQYRVLVSGATQAEYVSSGHLTYVMNGTIFAAPFDLERLAITGPAVPVVDGVQMALNAGAAGYAISASGTLAYLPPAPRRALAWVDRAGHVSEVAMPPRAYHGLRLSPDGSRVALEVREEQDIYIWDFAGASLTRLTFDSAMDAFPTWTPDSRRIVFASTRSGAANLYMQAADGTGAPARVTDGDRQHYPYSISPEGYVVLGTETLREGAFITFFPIGSATPAARRTTHGGYGAIVSPDGRFFAYQSAESGRFEVYVRPYPDSDQGRWQISTDGGSAPVWARDGRQLYYLNTTSTLMSVPIDTKGVTPRAGTPTRVLDIEPTVPGNLFTYDVSPDGSRFLMIREAAMRDPNAAPADIVVVRNWLTELRERTAVGR